MSYLQDTDVISVTIGSGLAYDTTDPENPVLSASGSAVIESNLQTIDYTVVLSDAAKVVEMNSASARTITVPPNSAVAFSTGTIIELHRYGTGTVTVVAGSGVTIRSPGGFLTLERQYSTATLRKRGTDEWVLSGSIG